MATDAKRELKFPVADLCLVPDAAILDPLLTCALPKSITADTGMDAFTHAIEAYTNCFASQKVRHYALDAMKLIHENLLSAYMDGYNLPAREHLLLGSYYAGIAFTNGYVGYVHAIAHALGGLYHIPHGQACATVLPLCSRHMVSASPVSLRVSRNTSSSAGRQIPKRRRPSSPASASWSGRWTYRRPSQSCGTMISRDRRPRAPGGQAYLPCSRYLGSGGDGGRRPEGCFHKKQVQKCRPPGGT